MPEAKRSKRSWLTDEQRYHKIIKPAIGAKPLPAITREDIQGIIDSLVESGAAPSTIKQYRSIINYTFTQASLTKLQGTTIFGGQNPVRGVKIPPIKNARERFLTAKEVKSLINAAKKLPCIDLHVDNIHHWYEGYQDVEGVCRVATLDEIRKNDYNLNIPRYVEPVIEEESLTIDQALANLKSSLQAAYAAEDRLKDLLLREGLL